MSWLSRSENLPVGQDASDPNRERSPLHWPGWTLGIIAATLGAGLASNVGSIHGQMGTLVMRSPVTIAVTTFIRENCHPRLYEWEQDLLAHLSLAPYFLLCAITTAFVFSPRISQGLIMLPIAYAVVFAPQLLLSSSYFEAMGLRWYHMLPSAIYVFCLIPITQLGINACGVLRQSRSFRAANQFGGSTDTQRNYQGLWRPFLQATVAVLAMLCIAFVPIKSLQPILLLVVLCVLSYVYNSFAPYRNAV